MSSKSDVDYVAEKDTTMPSKIENRIIFKRGFTDFQPKKLKISIQKLKFALKFKSEIQAIIWSNLWSVHALF